MKKRSLLFVLFLDFAVLGAAGAIALYPSDDSIADIPAAPPVVGPAPMDARQNQPINDLLAEVLARPLFNASRRPAVALSTEDTELAGLRLTAIVINSQERIAVFAVAGGKPLELGEGDQLRGRRIETITSEAVSLSGQDGIKTLHPTKDTALIPAPPPNAAAATSAVAAPLHSPTNPTRFPQATGKPAR